MSVIKKVQFIKSAVNPKDYPQPKYPEVAVVGRSNVGKSSLINAIFKRNIAKVSSSPGKTRLINFFLLNDRISLLIFPDTVTLLFQRQKEQNGKDDRKVLSNEGKSIPCYNAC